MRNCPQSYTACPLQCRQVREKKSQLLSSQSSPNCAKPQGTDASYPNVASHQRPKSSLHIWSKRGLCMRPECEKVMQPFHIWFAVLHSIVVAKKSSWQKEGQRAFSSVGSKQLFSLLYFRTKEEDSWRGQEKSKLPVPGHNQSVTLHLVVHQFIVNSLFEFSAIEFTFTNVSLSIESLLLFQFCAGFWLRKTVFSVLVSSERLRLHGLRKVLPR